MDDSVSPDSESSEVASSNTELPVSIATLEIGGVAPDKGDPVSLSVDGTVTRIVNGVAYVRVETVNDQPLPAAIIEPDGEDEMDRLERMSREVSMP